MAINNPRIFFYLLIPAVFIIFVYSFIFTKFSSQPRFNNYQQQQQLINFNESVAFVSHESTLSGEFNRTNVINTIKEYPLLEHNPKDTNFWSQKFEKRYQQIINNSNDNFPLKVIIVPHSHNDPGWLNTYDQYFYHYTFYILDNMVKNLSKHPNMTFIWSEMSFFSRWWTSIHKESTKTKLRKLLKEGRFEIVTGGWVMSDEGAAHYFDMVDQLIEGHQFLRSTLNFSSAPRNSWSIDPFGHGATFPYLLQKSGISNSYIQRTHFAWKRHLSQKRSLEFFWRQFFQKQRSENEQLFCHMSPLDLYSFKYACGPDYKVCLEFDFRKILGESSESTAVALNRTNIDSKSHKIIKQYSKLASLFPHNVALVLLGDDFRYNFDLEWQQQYDNYNYLMNYINSNKAKFNNTEIQFGTLQDYFNVVNERLAFTDNNFPNLYGDFMPYSDVYVNSIPNFWTGYYTTRPYYKLLSRELQLWLRSTEILYTFTRNYATEYLKDSNINLILNKDYNLISTARQNLALFQHHDGITGTSKDYVMEDYGRRLGHSISNMMEVAARSIQYLNLNQAYASTVNNSDLFIFSHSYKPNWNELTKRHILKIPADENGLKLLVFNSQLQQRTESIKLLVEDPFIKIIDVESGLSVNFQVNPVFNDSILSSSVFEIEFIDTFYPLYLKNYKLLTSEDNINFKVKIIEFDDSLILEENKLDYTNEAFLFEKSPILSLENEVMKIMLNKKGLIEQIVYKATNTSQEIEMSFVAYNSEPTESGAYLFKPNKHNRINQLFKSVSPRFHLLEGRLSSTLVVNYTDIIYSIKLYNSSSLIDAAIELKVFIDLENKDQYNDQEIALRIKTPIYNRNKKSGTNEHRTFYVDSNGFQMLERNFVDEVGVEGNYYPMTTAIYIEDIKSRFTILSSHSHGATSPADGQLEVMLDRRIIDDDKRGLSQGILDNLAVESSFWLVFEQFNARNNAFQKEIPVLSKLADSLLLYLNYPSLVTYSYKPDKEISTNEASNYYSNRHLIAPNLICQYFLFNLRTLPRHDNFARPSSSSLLVLHHRASLSSDHFSMPSYHNLNQCDIVNNSIASKQGIRLFNDLKIVSIQRSSLSGMETLQSLYSISEIKVPMFELGSYNVTFG